MADDFQTLRVTPEDLKAGLTLQTGRKYKLVLVQDLVEVHIDWPRHIVDRLPDDFTLTLSGPELPKQRLTKEAAKAIDDDMMRFELKWRHSDKTVTLEASGNGQTVSLWRDHVSGDLSVPIDWDRCLDALLVEAGEVEMAGVPMEVGVMPADLRAHELYDLLESLFG